MKQQLLKHLLKDKQARRELLYTKSINEFINIFPELDLAEIRCGYYLLCFQQIPNIWTAQSSGGNNANMNRTNCRQNTLAFT